MQNDVKNFIQANSPDGGFLQSEEWKKFQESVGRKTCHISADGFWANIIEHSLPVVGKYFYVPRGPITEIPNSKFQTCLPARQVSNQIKNQKSKIQNGMEELVELAKKNKASWIRIEPAVDEVLEMIKNVVWNKNFCSVRKAPHDMQPKEIFVMDISKSEDDLLAKMKSKTRYNIRLAEKKGVLVQAISNFKFQTCLPARQVSNQIQNSNDKNKSEKYLDEFLRLVRITAERDGITSHPENYYRKMLETIPGEILKLYVAEYEGKTIATNLVLFYGDTCTYMHGASDSENRKVMAPYLLQWQQIKDARMAGCTKYDFGGVSKTNSGFAGITKFKKGFSPKTSAIVFPGSYDIIIERNIYLSYRGLQLLKKLFCKL